MMKSLGISYDPDGLAVVPPVKEEVAPPIPAAPDRDLGPREGRLRGRAPCQR